jgi:cytochrome c5
MTQSIARVGIMLVAVLGSASVLEAQAPDGAALYKRSCASCHDTGANRAPAYSTTDGKILWDFDTIRSYDTVNGVPGRGGSIDGPGASIGGGMVVFNSGYPTAGGTPGNVLLAFSVEGR